MRHRKHKHLLGVKSAHRLSLLANLCSALIENGRIRTTLAKAKALRPFAEKIITLAKKSHLAEDKTKKLHFRRLAIARIRNKKAVKKLFDELAESFVDRPGGYTRIYKLATPRLGDAADMALIELVEASDEGYAKKKSKKKKPAKAVPQTKENADEEKPAEEVPSSEESDTDQSEDAVAVEDKETTDDDSQPESGESPAEDSKPEDGESEVATSEPAAVEVPEERSSQDETTTEDSTPEEAPQESPEQEEETEDSAESDVSSEGEEKKE